MDIFNTLEGILKPLEILYFMAVLQAALIFVYLIFQKRGNAYSRQILAFLLLIFIVFLSGTYLLLFKGSWARIHYAHILNLTVLLAPPILYLYYQSVVRPGFKYSPYLIIHLIPFVLITGFILYIFSVKSNPHVIFRPIGIALVFVLFIQNLFYLFAVIKENKSFRELRVENSKVKWFKALLICIFLIFALKMIMFLTWNVFGYVDVCIFLTGLFFIFSFIIINMLVLYSLFNNNVLVNSSKYQSSTLGNNEKEESYKRLLERLRNDKLYLDPLLSLEKLAKLIQINHKQLSQIINELAGCNFNDLINSYRIKEAQLFMKEDKDNERSILNIAYEVGFNSKSTFNAAFKKFANMSPSDYRKSIS